MQSFPKPETSLVSSLARSEWTLSLGAVKSGADEMGANILRINTP